MKPPERLETTRLLLRKPRLEDAPAIFEEYARDTDVTRYLTWKPHRSIDETYEFLQRCAHVWEVEAAFPWVLLRKETGRLMGMAELRIDGCRADVGYVLNKKEWGNGYMTEAVCAIARWALEQESIYRVWAVCDAENNASARVLEKVGMEKEGLLRRWIMHPNLGNGPRDCLCYSMVKSRREGDGSRE